MRQEDAAERGDMIRPDDWLKRIPFAPAAASGRLDWVGLEAARYRAAPAVEYHPPAITHHWLVLFIRPPAGLDLRVGRGQGAVAPAARSIPLGPGRTPSRWQWS